MLGLLCLTFWVALLLLMLPSPAGERAICSSIPPILPDETPTAGNLTFAQPPLLDGPTAENLTLPGPILLASTCPASNLTFSPPTPPASTCLASNLIVSRPTLVARAMSRLVLLNGPPQASNVTLSPPTLPAAHLQTSGLVVRAVSLFILVVFLNRIAPLMLEPPATFGAVVVRLVGLTVLVGLLVVRIVAWL